MIFFSGHNNVNETLMNNNSSNYAAAFEASLQQNASGAGGGAGDSSTSSQFSAPNFPVMSKIFPQHLSETSSMTTSTSIATTTSTDLTRIGKQLIKTWGWYLFVLMYLTALMSRKTFCKKH